MPKTLLHTLAALSCAALLAACGGGGDADQPMPPPVSANEVPASATASPAAYSQFAGSVKASENGEPLKVDKVQPPTSETDEPIDVI